MEAMRRHPSFIAKQRAAAQGGDSQPLSAACAPAAERRRERFRLVAVDAKTR
jgi:hypothetical protein